MKNIILKIATVIGTVISGLSLASPQDCEVYMKYGIYDKYNIEGSRSHFKQIQSYFSEKHFGSYQEAVDSSTKSGLNVIDILSLDFDGHNSKNQWSQWFDSFLKTNFETVQDNQQYRSHIEKVSHEINDIVKACIEANTEGFFAWIEPSPDHKIFTFNSRYIHLSGTKPYASISGFDITPTKIKSSCGTEGLAQFKKKQRISGAGSSVTCTRDPSDTVVVTLNTDEGTKAPRLEGYIPAPPTASISVEPNTIDKGNQAKLNWSTSDATSVMIEPGLGSVESVGSRNISPATDTTFDLTATGPGGALHKNAYVKVNTPLMITSLVAIFWTDGDDKDRNDGVSESYQLKGNILGSNFEWGKDLTFRNDSKDNGQTFNVNIPYSECNNITYNYRMTNDDGWKVTFEIRAKLNNGEERKLASEFRSIANGNPREGAIQFHCPS